MGSSFSEAVKVVRFAGAGADVVDGAVGLMPDPPVDPVGVG